MSKQNIQSRMWKLHNDGVPKNDIYTQISEHYNISRKKTSAYWLDLIKQPLRDKAQLKLIDIDEIPPVSYTKPQIKKILKQEGENLTISANVDFEVRTLEDLLAACEVDGEKWQVISWECTKWEVGRKDKTVEWHIKDGVTVQGDVSDSGKIHVQPLWRVKAKLAPRKLDNDVKRQKDVILKELFEKAPIVVVAKDINAYQAEGSGGALLELALFDVHFGKLAHREECGDDYDLKIAVKRYKTAIEELLGSVDLKDVERILLPIGNDMINIDGSDGNTTAGTPQDSDSRFYKIVRTVKNLLIETINELMTIAPVDVVVVAGNHDEESSFMIGEMLDAYYHNMERVTVRNEASSRKYYQYGKTAFMFTHGNKEKHANLGMIFAAENPKLWAATTQRYIQIGHYHHNKKINYLANEEFQGFQIQIIPSLSGSDAWHAGKGFNSLKQAKAFLYCKNKGLYAELTHTSV